VCLFDCCGQLRVANGGSGRERERSNHHVWRIANCNPYSPLSFPLPSSSLFSSRDLEALAEQLWTFYDESSKGWRREELLLAARRS